MIFFNKKIREASSLLSKLPGIGPRQATRLAYFLSRENKERTLELARAISELSFAGVCQNCFFIHENGVHSENLCDICSNPSRDRKIIALVEKETDLISIENTENFSGTYLVLGDLKKNGILEEEQRKRIEHLKKNTKESLGGKAEEIILATNPTTFGDFSASMLEKELSPFADKITRLGRGIPTGGEIEFADADTLSASLKNRS